VSYYRKIFTLFAVDDSTLVELFRKNCCFRGLVLSRKRDYQHEEILIHATDILEVLIW